MLDHVVAGLAHAVWGGAAESGEVDMAIAVVTGIGKRGPDSDA